MSSVNVNIINNSGRSLDKLVMYHNPSAPSQDQDLSSFERFFCGEHIPNGANIPINGVGTQSGDAFDYWIGGVLFEGDGNAYIVTADSFVPPYKEYAVSDGGNLTITINPYQSGESNPSNMTFDDHTGDPGTAQLLNQQAAVQEPWKFVQELVNYLHTPGCQ